MDANEPASDPSEHPRVAPGPPPAANQVRDEPIPASREESGTPSPDASADEDGEDQG